VPLDVSPGAPTVVIRKAAFDRTALSRTVFDDRFNLTPDEFRVEGDLVAIGPLPQDTALTDLINDLEAAGLTYFDDFFELSGNWPEWLTLYARAIPPKSGRQ
jgi:hypothetical protein